MKKIIIAAISVLVVFALIACSNTPVNQEVKSTQADEKAEEKGNELIVAKVGDKDITKAEVMEMVDKSLEQMGITQEQYIEQVGVEAFNDELISFLDSFASQEMLFQEAVKRGMADESEENKNAIKAEIEKSYEDFKKQVLDDVDPEITDEAQRQAEADKQFNKVIADMPSIDEQIDQQLRYDAIYAVQDDIIKDVAFSETDAKAYYDEQLKSVEDTTQNSKNAAENSEEAQDVTDTSTQTEQNEFVRPTEARYVKHILISIPEDKQMEIGTLKSEGKEEEAQKLLDEEIAKIKPAIDEAYKRATNGEDFDALIEELGKDPGMTQVPAKTQGYLVYKNSGMVAPFEEAALALGKEGDISKPVVSDFGYHIIKFEKDAGGVIPFEEVKENIISEQLLQKQRETIESVLEELKKDYNVKLFNDVLTNES